MGMDGKLVSDRNIFAILVSPTKGVSNREKFVWEWPDPMARIIDELG